MGKDSKSLFRQKALDKLARPEVLDERLIVVTAKSWFLLIGLYALLFCLLIWSLFGVIPVRVSGEGLLLYGNSHIYNASVSAAQGGNVVKFLVQQGASVEKNQSIALLEQPQLKAQIKIAADFIKKFETEYQDTQQQAKQSLLTYRQQSDVQLENFNKMIAQTEVMQAANKSILIMRQALYKEGIEDKQSVVEAIQAYQQAKNDINSTLEKIAENKKDQLAYEQQWTQRLQTLKETLNDKLKAYLFLIKQYNIGKYVRSPVDGQVINFLASLGDFVSTGKAVANIAPYGHGLEAIVFVPADDGKRIKVGMSALVYPTDVRKNEYGGIYGKVTSISAFPSPPASIIAALQNEEMLKKFSQQGPSFSIHIRLLPSKNTYSGYAWSSSDGPRQKISAGTPVDASITVEKRRPISLLIPALRSLISEN